MATANQLATLKAELETRVEQFAGLRHEEIVDILNNPVPVGKEVSYRPVTVQEVADASPIGLVKIQKAAGDYEAAANPAEQNAAQPGAALAARLLYVGTVDVAPGSVGRSILDGAVAGGFLSAAERNALVAAGTIETPVLKNFWQREGWNESVTVKMVKEARG